MYGPKQAFSSRVEKSGLGAMFAGKLGVRGRKSPEGVGLLSLIHI